MCCPQSPWQATNGLEAQPSAGRDLHTQELLNAVSASTALQGAPHEQGPLSWAAGEGLDGSPAPSGAAWKAEALVALQGLAAGPAQEAGAFQPALPDDPWQQPPAWFQYFKSRQEDAALKRQEGLGEGLSDAARSQQQRAPQQAQSGIAVGVKRQPPGFSKPLSRNALPFIPPALRTQQVMAAKPARQNRLGAEPNAPASSTDPSAAPAPQGCSGAGGWPSSMALRGSPIQGGPFAVPVANGDTPGSLNGGWDRPAERMAAAGWRPSNSPAPDAIGHAARYGAAGMQWLLDDEARSQPAGEPLNAPSVTEASLPSASVCMALTAEQGAALNLPAVCGLFMSAPKLVAWGQQPAHCQLARPQASSLCEACVCELQALSAE